MTQLEDYIKLHFKISKSSSTWIGLRLAMKATSVSPLTWAATQWRQFLGTVSRCRGPRGFSKRLEINNYRLISRWSVREWTFVYRTAASLNASARCTGRKVCEWFVMCYLNKAKKQNASTGLSNKRMKRLDEHNWYSHCEGHKERRAVSDLLPDNLDLPDSSRLALVQGSHAGEF